MGRKLNLSHLSQEESEQILSVLQNDFEVRQTEKDRIGSIQHTLKQEQSKTHLLGQQNTFNKNCCIRCCQVFGFIFNRRRQCFTCGYNVCKNCCDYNTDTKRHNCYYCIKQKELNKQSCDWFYNATCDKFKRFGSAKVVRSLYKTTSYCKLKHQAKMMTQGGLGTLRHTISTLSGTLGGKNNGATHYGQRKPDTELESGYGGSGASRSYHVTSRLKARPRLPDAFRDDRDDDTLEEEDDGDSDDVKPHKK